MLTKSVTTKSLVIICKYNFEAMHFESLTIGMVPTCLVFGECNTGKSFAVEAALNLTH